MRKTPTVLLAFSLLALAAVATAAEPCRYSAPRNVELDAAGLKTLAVELGPNRLVIRGQPGLTRIVVHGTACASNARWLDDVKVEATRSGTVAHLIADNGNHDVVTGLFGDHSAYARLDVEVPAALATSLTVGSGTADAGGLAALDATVGSGDLKAARISGGLGLRVGSGDAVATDVGSLALASLGSGDVTVQRVGGAATLGTVGSGDLTLQDVRGGVTLESLASGDVKLTTIGGVTAGSIGSGDLVVRDAGGNVLVRALGSGDVDVHGAGGNVHADSVGSGDFKVDGVGGEFSVGAVGSGDVAHRGVRGKVSVPQRD
jgi:hypothetical protein